MIDITHNNKGWEWNGVFCEGVAANPDVWGSDHYRLSALLGPDGNYLKVGYERPKMGFDLRGRVNK